MNDFPRELTKEESEVGTDVDENLTTVVMGAMTECTGNPNSKKVGLRTDPIGTNDGYGIKILNIDTDKDKNFMDEGTTIHLVGEKAGSLVIPTKGSDTPSPTEWYGNCTKLGGKCNPDFVDEWFDPSDTVTISKFNNSLNEYNKTMADAKKEVNSAIDNYVSKHENRKNIGYWFAGLWGGNDPKNKLKKTPEKPQIDPEISSRTDANNDITSLESTLNALSTEDKEFINDEAYIKAKENIDNAKEYLPSLVNTETEGFFPLLKKSKLVCKHGGVVSINDNGQILSLIDFKIKKMKEEFPSCYHDALEDLIKKYPEASFNADNYDYTLQQRIDIEKSFIKTDPPKNSSYPKWGGDNVYATDEQINYYFDPRNYLNESNFFSFYDNKTTSQYDAVYKNSFVQSLKNTPWEPFADEFYATAINSGVNPFAMIALAQVESTFMTNPSSLASGKNNVYNYYGIEANDNRPLEERVAISKNLGFTTPRDGAILGMRWIIKNYPNQTNEFTKRFERLEYSNGQISHQPSHQYGTSVNMAYLKGSKIYEALKDSPVPINGEFTIPVYKDICKNLPAKLK